MQAATKRILEAQKQVNIAELGSKSSSTEPGRAGNADEAARNGYENADGAGKAAIKQKEANLR